MKTAIHGRWNRHASGFPETKALWQVRENLDRGKAILQELHAAQDRLTLHFLGLLEKIGIDVVSDGSFRWDSGFDIARELNGCGDFKTLHRIPETNHFHRAPEIRGKIESRKPILAPDVDFLRSNSSKEILVSLPGPYTLSRQSILLGSRKNDFWMAVLDFSSALNFEISQLLKISGVSVKIDDPQILSEGVDWGMLKSNYDVLTATLDKKRIFLATWFHRLPAREDFFNLPFGGFFTDFASSREVLLGNVNSLMKFPSDKILGAGIVDSRQPAMPSNEDLLFWIREIQRRVPLENLWLTPNADLDFLPWEISVSKIKQLAELKKEALQ